MSPIKRFLINLIVILSSFVCHIASVSINNVSNELTNQQVATRPGNSYTASLQSESMPDFYTSSQALKFRVNVSNICEKNHMRVTVRLSRPFYGLIHTKDKRKKAACQVEGTGEQTYIMQISYTLVQSDSNYCGIVSHQLTQAVNQSMISTNLQQTLSVALVVRLHKTIEFSDDRYFLLSCANRCPKLDCSTSSETSSHSTAGLGNSRGLTASESILAPVLRATDPIPKGNNGKLAESTTNGWTTVERCDHLIDIKFQWLAKICWALAILLIAMFCTSYCLCLALNKNKSRKNNQPSGGRRGSRKISHPFDKPSNPTIEAHYPTHLNPNLSAGAHSAGSSWSGVQVGAEDINKFQDDNTFVGKQHQEFVLADLLTKNGHSIDREKQHRADQQQFMVLGRAAGPFHLSTSQMQNDALDMRVKRRRSIGSSMAALPLEYEKNTQQASDWYSAGKLDANQRAKSRSQTTIHYSQGQDPFKTVPFAYLNNGYISDGNTSKRIYLSASSGASHAYGPAPQDHQVAMDSQQLTLPMPKSHLNAPQLSSQFDPQNSRQLIDLIQHKHWQQMAQADRTAANMQEVQRNRPVVQAGFWR